MKMLKFIKDNIMFFLVTIMLIVLAVWSAKIITERDNPSGQVTNGNATEMYSQQEGIING